MPFTNRRRFAAAALAAAAWAALGAAHAAEPIKVGSKTAAAKSDGASKKR